MSRLGAEWECWALFNDRLNERLSPDYPRDIASDDPDLLTVAQIFGFTIEPLRGHRVYVRPWRKESPDT
jgi:hypothetical protein